MRQVLVQAQPRQAPAQQARERHLARLRAARAAGPVHPAPRALPLMIWQLRCDPRRHVALGGTAALSQAPGVRQDFERLDVKMTLGAAQRRARASEARRFLSGCRGGFLTIGPRQNLSSARVEP
jgi:hypothetical protein